MSKLTGEAFRFYEQNYEGLGQWILVPGKKVFLGVRDNRCCRFCGERSPEVTFRQDAHAIPELLGNKSLFTYYECDACNELFGRGIENDLGNWSKPMRTLARIRGKTGVPTIKRTHRGFRIEGVSRGLHVTHGEADPVFEVDKDKREVTFKLPRDPYTPVAILKAFVKIGLALLPAEEIPNFQSALEWIRSEDHSIGVLFDWTVWHTFMPGAYRSDITAAMVFRRKRDAIDLPYAFFVLMYGNEMFQVFLPAPERDKHIEGKPLTIYRFPSLLDLQPSDGGLPESGPLNLTGTTVVKDDVVTALLTYSQRLKTGSRRN
jgi:hypothetical protein